jgi:membrane associated rhomboid family serine protease
MPMQDEQAVRGRREPIVNAPGVVAGLICLFGLVHAALEAVSWFGGEDRADWVVLALALIPARYSGLAGELPGAPWAGLASFVTHAVVHGGLMHLGLNSLWLLAVGSPLARRMGVGRFLAFFILCAVGGGVLFWLLNIGLQAPMVGASGAISGLMAAVLRLIYAAEGRDGRRLLREHPELAPRLSLPATFQNRQCMIAIAVWAALNIIVGVFAGSSLSPGGVAWEAHLGGFLTGLLAFGLFDRQRPRAASTAQDTA